MGLGRRPTATDARGPRAGRRGRGRTDTPLTRHRLLRPARLPFRHSPGDRVQAAAGLDRAPTRLRRRTRLLGRPASLAEPTGRAGRAPLDDPAGPGRAPRPARPFTGAASAGRAGRPSRPAAQPDRRGHRLAGRSPDAPLREAAALVEVLGEGALERPADRRPHRSRARGPPSRPPRAASTWGADSACRGPPACNRLRIRRGPPRTTNAVPPARAADCAGARRILAGTSTASRVAGPSPSNSTSRSRRAATTSARAASVRAPTRSSPSRSRWSGSGRTCGPRPPCRCRRSRPPSALSAIHVPSRTAIPRATATCQLKVIALNAPSARTGDRADDDRHDRAADDLAKRAPPGLGPAEQADQGAESGPDGHADDERSGLRNRGSGRPRHRSPPRAG